MLSTSLIDCSIALNRSGIRWCALDDPDDPDDPSDPDDPDPEADLLVASGDVRKVSEVLRRQRFLRLPGRCSPATYVSYYRPTDRWVHVRLHCELSYGPQSMFQTRAEAACLARLQREGSLCVLHPDDRFWTLLLDSMLNRNQFGSREVRRLHKLASSACLDGPLAKAIDAERPAGWTARHILDHALKGAWHLLEDLGRYLSAVWRRRLRPVRALRNLVDRVRGVVVQTRLGSTVALLGPDGAGKSSLAANLLRSYILPARAVYMGLWQQEDHEGNQFLLPGWRPVRRLLRAWRGYLVGQYHRSRGRLVIFDRYTYDALLSLSGDRRVLERLYLWVLGHSCPSPDLVIVLDVPGEVMYARKHESSPERLEAERQGFRALGCQIPRLQVMDGTSPQESLRLETIDAIWRRLTAG